MVIEIDGSQHETEQGIAYDSERSAVLEGLGLKVMRFDNFTVDHDFTAVCEAIHTEVVIRTPLKVTDLAVH